MPSANRYGYLWLLGIAIGWFEASVAIYLRELYYPDGFRFPLVIIPGRIAAVEVIREAASIVLLSTAARLAGRSFLERFAIFMLLFGIWDLVYYGVLKLVIGWPENMSTWDILFLIPVPWIGPVWAPCVVSIALIAAGSYLYRTIEHPRTYRKTDWIVVIIAGLIVISTFLTRWRVVAEHQIPRDFPESLFWTGWLLGVGWFVRAERRSERTRSRPGSAG